MKTPMGVVLVACYISLFGLAALKQSSTGAHDSRPVGENIQLVGLALLCFIAVGAVLVRHTSALRIYSVWTALWLAAGGLTQYLQEVPPLEIIGWLLLMGALFGAFGLYFKSALAARPNSPLHLATGAEIE